MRRLIAVLIVLSAMPLAFAQTQAERDAMQSTINEAERALTAAENAGAPVYAKDLYDEALAKLTIAKQTRNDQKRSVREAARLRAIEAKHAARASEAKGRLVLNTTEARALRVDITRFGGMVAEMTFQEDIPETARGETSLDRVNFAQAWVDRAKAAGGHLVAPEDMKTAESWLESARRIARSDRQNESADHLAYTAEMLSRRAYYLALRSEVDRTLPGLRLERTRLAQEMIEREATAERQRREQAERELTEMRQRLETEAASRRAQQQELDALRSQLADRERAIQSQLESDRIARLEAEQRLFDLVAKYEAAIARADTVEVEALRRQVEDQRLSLQSTQERQRLSEQSLTAETERLREELERERTSGKASVQALSERETELSRREQELERLRLEREESVRRASETAQRLTEVEQRARVAEEESQRLREQVQQAQERAQQVQAELERVRAERDRLERMQQLVGTGATVRADTRGMIVTLPGIYFDSGKSTLKPGARNILSKVSDELKRMTDARIAVEGHTDNVGSEEANHELSHRRAEAVKEFLVTQGIDSGRITVTGRGEAVPVATNDTAAGRQQNRRVEIIISQ